MESPSSQGAFLYTVAFGLVAGVAISLIFTIGVVLPLVCLIGAGALLIVGRFVRKKVLLLLAIALVACVLGMVRGDLFLYQESQQTITTFSGKATIVGTVVNDPEVSGTHLQAAVLVTSVNAMPARGSLLAFLPPATYLSYGDMVTLQGTLATPASFVGDNGNIFDYPTYLRVQGISMLLNQAQIVSAERGSLSLYGVLFWFKHAFDASLERMLPKPEVLLLEGILLGERHGLPAVLTQAFVVAGLIHIVILSGYSMSVVSEGILRSLAFLPRRWQLFFAALCMMLFVVMTGAAPTTVRACAMALVALVARYLHRTALALRSLAAVAAAMVLYNPPLILGNASFIVSVLATFGLIIFAPSIERMLWRIPSKFDMRSIITSTIAVQLFALPALLYFTGNISYLSVPANLLVLPLLPFIMIAGVATGILGFLNTAFAFLPAVLVRLLLQWILLVVHVVGEVPFASTTLTAFPLWLAIAMYVPLTTLAIYLLRQSAPQ